MTLRSLAFSATISMSALSAQAGTIVFHTGDGAHPPSGIDFWSESHSGSLLSTSCFYSTDFPVAGSVYVQDFSGEFHHSHWAEVPGSPPIPEAGVKDAYESITGDAYWWFEYVPDYPGDVPSGTYYADIQYRGKAEAFATVRSDRGGGAASVDAGISGLLTGLIPYASVSSGPARDDQHETTFGFPSWRLNDTPIGFTFGWDPASGTWIGKALLLNAGKTDIASYITISDLNEGFADITYERQFQVLRVRTPSSGTFTFNTPWT